MATLFLGVIASWSAHADLVIYFDNRTSESLKSIVQNIGIQYLRPGQAHEFRIEGDLVGGNYFTITPPTRVPDTLTTNFEHISNAGIQYCVWEITRTVRPGSLEARRPARVEINARLIESDADYRCEVSGQLIVASPTIDASDIDGATITLTVSPR